MLLARGLATVQKHRTDDERSAHYEALLEAEQVDRLLSDEYENQSGSAGKRERYSAPHFFCLCSVLGSQAN